ncbi:MAG TPA: imidazolonepropionase [Candidatus Kapabacteria bacterium]|jgi:imidazolonepropionase|nr:imidazolonepropionase [Candidatus Kapabacteria bacterium]
MKLYHNIRLLYTPEGRSMLKGHAMRHVLRVEDAAVLTSDDGLIQQVGPLSEISAENAERIDCRGLVALPGFVDSHTHAVFMGERSLEFGMRAAGKSYQEIAEAGGGIRSTVEKVGNASPEEIAAYSKKYVLNALKLGTTTMEVKSGYGLTTQSEINLLKAAEILSRETPLDIIRTFMGAHAIPKGTPQAEYVDQVIEEQLPALPEGLAEFADVFTDCGYFTNEETVRILEACRSRGLKPKMHADELCDTGGAALAARLDAFSADHLLKINDDGIAALAASDRTVATLLPITALSIRSPFAPARKLIDAGSAVAIATDCNPGSSMSENMQLAMTLAVIGMQMTVEESLIAATLNGAAAIDRAHTHGSIEVGKVCDMVLYDIPRLEYLPYHVGVSDIVSVIKRGEIVSGEALN